MRVWNYLEKTCRLKKQFEVDVTAVTLHPSGLYLVVGLTDKLRLYNITSTDLVQLKEFHVPGCQVCRTPGTNAHRSQRLETGAINVYMVDRCITGSDFTERVSVMRYGTMADSEIRAAYEQTWCRLVGMHATARSYRLMG